MSRIVVRSADIPYIVDGRDAISVNTLRKEILECIEDEDTLSIQITTGLGKVTYELLQYAENKEV